MSEGANNKRSDAGNQAIPASPFEPLSQSKPAAARLSWPKIGMALAVAVLLGCLLFLLTARSVEIAVDAIGEPTITIDGFTISLGERQLILPGQYPMTVTVPGYRPWQQTIEVTDDDAQRIAVNPAILPGKVSVQSLPTGATVSLDDTLLGVTPIDEWGVAAGSYRLRVTAPRYQAYEASIDITGRGIRQTFAPQLNPDWAAITVRSEPEDAQIFIDGDPAGRTNSTVDLASGDRQLTLRRAGYQDHALTIAVRASIPQTLETITLIPADGVLSLSSTPTGAIVSLDGEFTGRTPLTLELSPEEAHVIQLSKVGYARKTISLTLEKGALKERQVTLIPQLGEVIIRVDPPDAEVRVNGKLAGVGNRTLTLPAFEHRLEIGKPGYVRERRRVTPRPGLEQLLDVTLLTDAQARKAALQEKITNALGQTLVLIDPLAEPTNPFSMGTDRRQPGRRSNEVEHTVRLERAFYLATTETTNAQFRLFLESHDSGQIEGNSLNRERQPVTQISWQQAARFCNWLSKREGLAPFYRDNEGIMKGYNGSSTGYRLPTEAEWSYAARVEGERYRRFAWGNDFPPTSAVVNVADNTSALVTGRILNGYADGYIVSAPVGSFPENHRGLFDMGGNVAEWVHDVYVIPSANADIVTDPLGGQNGDNYTVRGASWALSRLSELRLTYRDYGARGRDDLGFRIARYAE